MPSRQSCSNVMASLPSTISRSLRRSSSSRNEASSLISSMWWTSKRPAVSGPSWRQTLSVEVADGRSRDRSTVARRHSALTCSSGSGSAASRTPAPRDGGSMSAGSPVHSHAATWAKLLVVAQRLALLGLVLGAEVTAAALLALQRVTAHQHPELEEVVDPAGLLQRLVDRGPAAGHLEVLLELLVQRRDLRQRLLQALLGALHAAVLPDDPAELAVEVVGRAGAADRRGSSGSGPARPTRRRRRPGGRCPGMGLLSSGAR